MQNAQILVKPIISEKSLNQASAGWYTFAVQTWARKPEIKRVIEATFSVKVLAVKTMTVKGKTKRAGRRQQQVTGSAWKKAIVLLPTEQKIDLFEVPTSSPQSGVSAPARASLDKSAGKPGGK